MKRNQNGGRLSLWTQATQSFGFVGVSWREEDCVTICELNAMANMVPASKTDITLKGELIAKLSDLTDTVRDVWSGLCTGAGICWESFRQRLNTGAEADRRIALAKADAEVRKINAACGLEITELELAGQVRVLAGETRRQENLESVLLLTAPMLREGGDQKIPEEDWLVHLFDKAKMFSDREMQTLWAKILAEEVNSPASFSRFTINLVASLGRYECEGFAKLCRFCWMLDDGPTLLIFDVKDPIYTDCGVNYDLLSHLETAGLIHYNSTGLIVHLSDTAGYVFSYFGESVAIAEGKIGRPLSTGLYKLTNFGLELFQVCAPEQVDGFFHYGKEQMRLLAVKRKRQNQETAFPLPGG